MLYSLSKRRCQLVLCILLIGCTLYSETSIPDCDTRELPMHIKSEEHGSTLKVSCPPELRPMEVDQEGVIISARSSFARYACIHGVYRRIAVKGAEPAKFFCAARKPRTCPQIQSTDRNIVLFRYQRIVSRVDYLRNDTFDVLYCAYGSWYNLYGIHLPPGIMQLNESKRIDAPTSESRHPTKAPTVKNKELLVSIDQTKRVAILNLTSSTERIRETSSNASLPTVNSFSINRENNVKLINEAAKVTEFWHRLHISTLYCLLMVLLALLFASLIILYKTFWRYKKPSYSKNVSVKDSLDKPPAV